MMPGLVVHYTIFLSTSGLAVDSLCCCTWCHGVPCCPQRRRNATRLCDHIVSAQCLQQKSPEGCIAELIANESRAAAEAAHHGDSANTVAIAVPVALGGAWCPQALLCNPAPLV